MKFFNVLSPEYGTNVYFLVGDDNKAVVIDASDYNLVKSVEKEHAFTVTDCLLTHGHFDHAGGCAKLQKEGVKIHIHKKDADKLLGNGNVGYVFGIEFEKLTPDFTFNGGDVLKINGFEFNVLHTPGHSKGSVCFIINDILISGDTLFYESIGRTDFYDGDYDEIMRSIKLLFDLDKDYLVYPGHGRITKLSHEELYNPFLREL